MKLSRSFLKPTAILRIKNDLPDFVAPASRAGRILMVAHTDRNLNVRIISARKATVRERKHYEEKN